MVRSRLLRAVRASGWDPAKVRLSSLHGGITNENYRAELDGESFVLRLNGRSAGALGIDRTREARCAHAAAFLGIGPEVVVSKPGLLVTRFIAGLTLSAKAAGQPATLKRVAAAIRRCHEGPRFPGVFSAFATVRRYCALARRKQVRLPKDLPDALALMGRIEQAVGRRRALKPCHNDLLASNFIADGGAIRIIDWEYAAMGDPFFDLGNFAANQGLSEDQSRAFLQSYSGQAGARDLARLNLQRLASDLREAAWGFAQAGLSELKFDFLGYGAKHLDRFLRRGRGLRFERWLREV